MLKFGDSLADCFLRKFVPSYRFIRIQPDTIDQQHVHQAGLDSRSIKVLNWNIAKKNHDRSWLRDFYRILCRYQPDLIFLQEVRFGIGDQHAVDITNMSWSFAPNFMDAHHRAYSGVLTAATTNPLTSRAIATEHYEPIVQTPKVSLVTEYPLANRAQTLLAVNSHLINFVDLAKFHTQLQDLEQLLQRHSGPILFAGDFNTWSQSRHRLVTSAAARLGLTSAFFADDSQKIKRFLFSPPLDYIFYKGLAERWGKTCVLGGVTSSDHKPLLAEFCWEAT